MVSQTIRPTMQETTEMVEMRSAGAKGNGLFARVDIRKGTRILAEAPFMTISLRMDMAQQFTEFVELANSMPHSITELDGFTYNPLFLNEQEPGNIITELRNKKDRIVDPEDAMVRRYAVFRTNCVGLQDVHSSTLEEAPPEPGAEPGSEPQYYHTGGLFLMYSRINHSCLPNVCFSWNRALGREVVHAARDISAGEEILGNYLGAEAAFMTKTQRIRPLWRGWGFECDCPACVEDTDALREDLAWLDGRLVDISEMLSDAHGRDENETLTTGIGKEGYATALELVGTLEEAGLGGTALCEAYKECCRFSMMIGDMGAAIEHAKMNLKEQKAILGDDLVNSKWIPATIRAEALRRYEEEDRQE